MISKTSPDSSAEVRRVRWGILGTGGIVRSFVGDLKLAGHVVSAVGSRANETAERFASAFHIPRAYGTYEEMVVDPAVDIVYIATPHPCHHAHATLALHAGKHALVEKPFTIKAAEAQSLAELAAERGLLVLEAMWTRWLPHMVAIRELVKTGAIGDIRAVVADHAQALSDDPSHRLNSLELGGGALLDLGVYPLSFASELLGAPVSIHAAATFRPTGVDAETGILLRYAEGRTAVIFTASNSTGPNRAAIIGTEGRIEIDSVWFAPTSFRALDASGRVMSTYESDLPGGGMQFQAKEAEQLIAARQITSQILPLSESVSIVSTMEEVRRQIGLRYPSEWSVAFESGKNSLCDAL